MEMLLVYFAKSSALMAAFFLAYYFLLRKETFFKSNRWYLLFGLVISVALPLVTFKKIVWIEPSGKGIDWSSITQTLPPIYTPEPEAFEINWLLVILSIYAIGTIGFLLKFFFDFYSLSKVLRGKTIMQQEDYKYLDVSENVSPFSYFNYIVYNSSLYSDAELRNILEHEKVHSSQNHTIDVLISRFFCILFWYNPFVWLYKKAILQNLEFIADSEASKNIADIKAYQRTLLKITTHDCCVAITNHFYQSLIKKRIVMLNKNQSKRWNSWKYSLIVPALVVFMLYFQVKVVAQEKQALPVRVITQQGVEVIVNKNTSDADLKKEAKRVEKEEGISLKFSKVKRNKNGEIIAIKAEFKDNNGQKGITQVSSDEPIQPIRFYKNGANAGFSQSKKSTALKIIRGDHDEDDAQTLSLDFGDISITEAPEAPESPEAPETPETPFTRIMKPYTAFSQTAGKATIIVDGKVLNIDIDKALIDLDPETIEKIRIMKSDATNGITEENGVIYIDTKKIKEAMQNATEQMKKARIEIERAKPEIERAKKEIEFSKPEIEKAKEEMKKAKAEMEQSKVEMQKAKAELDKAKAEIEKTKAELRKDKK